MNWKNKTDFINKLKNIKVLAYKNKIKTKKYNKLIKLLRKKNLLTNVEQSMLSIGTLGFYSSFGSMVNTGQYQNSIIGDLVWGPEVVLPWSVGWSKLII